MVGLDPAILSNGEILGSGPRMTARDRVQGGSAPPRPPLT